MNGNGPTNAPSHTGRPRGVMVVYANEPEGQRMSRALVRELRARGLDVISDHELARQNPVSVATWMDDQIAARIVVCVVTAGYRLGAEETIPEGTPKRKGVRYELRAIRQRIYDHDGRYDCPVIPVAAPGLPLDVVPATLRGLNLSRFDPDDGSGADELAARIAVLEGWAYTTPATGDRRRFREVLHELEADLSADHAVELVRECLRLAKDPDLSGDLVPAFPQLADIIKDHGQISLMRTLTERCLDALHTRNPLLRWEQVTEAGLLICGKAWYLQRDHLLREALDRARDGIRIAEHHQSRRIAAYGRQCVGRIHRLMAEDGVDVEHHLELSERIIGEAIHLFRAVDGAHPRRSEVGASLSLGARTQLARYRLLGEGHALACAEAMAGEAAGMLTAEQKKDRHDLAILRAEIAAAKRRYAESHRWLGGVIESLVAECGALSEILARAYVARAHIAPRSAKDEIITDLMKARGIFEGQQLAHAVASCDWEMLRVDPRTVTTVKIVRADIHELARLTADPRVRLAAVRKLEDQVVRRPVDWLALVDAGR